MSFGYILNSDIAGSWGKLFPNYLRNHHTDFQSNCTSLQDHQWMSVVLIPHPFQHKLSSEILFFTILTGVRSNLRAVLICISLIAKDVEHLLMCPTAL